MARKSLVEAKRLFQKRKYSDVVRILEPEVFAYRESFSFYYLLGLSCLFIHDKGGAYSYLTRALQLDDNNINVQLGLAAVHLKRRNQEDALKIWLKVKEQDSVNRTAARGLDLLRKGLDEAGLDDLETSGRIKTVYPAEPFQFPLFQLLSGVAGIAIIGLLAFIIPQLLPRPPEGRPDIEKVQVPLGTAYVGSQDAAPLTFTEYEAQKVFEDAKKFFLAYKDNPGVVQCNRLINSNASASLKEYARRLKGFAGTPGFKDFLGFPDNYAYDDVTQAPWLYDGCYILWRGTVANLSISPERISFQFLKGSWDNKLFEGSIPVVFHEATKLENDYYIELLGKVIAGEKGFRLDGVLQRRIIPGGS